MSGLGLGLGLGLGAHRIVDRYGNMPATFTIAAGFANTGAKRINFSEPVTVTMTGNVTLSIDGTPYQSGETIPVATTYHTLTINNPGEEAGTITFGKRKQITYLYLYGLGSSIITGDITGMKLTALVLISLGSSDIAGDITGMKLTALYLDNLGSSVFTGDITGMKLTYLYLYNLGSSLAYGTNPLNITNNLGVQLLGDTVFSANEYIQLFADAATCVADEKWTATTKVLTISGGDNPGWSNVSEYYDIIVGGGVTVKVPLAWESGDDAFPSETPNP
ncbi:MAG: hypothetical protein PHX12_06075 [Proteiniphilum sp.]|nr:hypothetical protein [Proteiniphilum sp.]